MAKCLFSLMSGLNIFHVLSHPDNPCCPTGYLQQIKKTTNRTHLPMSQSWRWRSWRWGKRCCCSSDRRGQQWCGSTRRHWSPVSSWSPAPEDQTSAAMHLETDSLVLPAGDEIAQYEFLSILCSTYETHGNLSYSYLYHCACTFTKINVCFLKTISAKQQTVRDRHDSRDQSTGSGGEVTQNGRKTHQRESLGSSVSLCGLSR